MNSKDKIKLFQEQTVRTHWDEEQEKWYFSVVDVVAVLTEHKSHQGARNYWKVLKHRLVKEGGQSVTICNQLKMQSADGKYYKTDIADTEQILRLIQSIPSPKAEPFKRWLAKTGSERIAETDNPELAFDRAMQTYIAKEWINQRLKSIEVRKELTDEWAERGMKQGLEYAILTNELTQAWAGKTSKNTKN